MTRGARAACAAPPLSPHRLSFSPTRSRSLPGCGKAMKRFLRSYVVWIVLVAAAVLSLAAGPLAVALLLTPAGYTEVVPGVLYRSKQPSGRQWDALKRDGIAMVVNLRPAAADPVAFAGEQDACAEAGVRLVHIPFASAVPTDDQIAEFLRAVRTSPGPVLVHCEYGRSRSGLMVGVYRVVIQGWRAEQAMAEMRLLTDRTMPFHYEEKLALLERLERDRRAWLDRLAADRPGRFSGQVNDTRTPQNLPPVVPRDSTGSDPSTFRRGPRASP